MHRQTESDVRKIFRDHIDRAVDEISEAELIGQYWWPEGYSERLAEILTQAMSFAVESGDAAIENGGE